jgi:hypothetical protein
MKDLFDIDNVKEKSSFNMDTSYEDMGQDDYFFNINKPSKKKKNLSDFKKINTKMSIQLHRDLKTYCGANDYKKNHIFEEALLSYMEVVHHSDTEHNLKYSKGEKEPFNFEIPLEFFKEVKSFAFQRGYKLATFYEQAVQYYLDKKANGTDS